MPYARTELARRFIAEAQNGLVDGINPRSADHHLRCLQSLSAANLLSKTLISQDSG